MKDQHDNQNCNQDNELAVPAGLDLQITFTKQQLQDRAKSYLVWLYGRPGKETDADKWMERFGLLCGFIDEQFEPLS